jgi:hypothetical protein
MGVKDIAAALRRLADVREAERPGRTGWSSSLPQSAPYTTSETGPRERRALEEAAVALAGDHPEVPEHPEWGLLADPAELREWASGLERARLLTQRERDEQDFAAQLSTQELVDLTKSDMETIRVWPTLQPAERAAILRARKLGTRKEGDVPLKPKDARRAAEVAEMVDILSRARFQDPAGYAERLRAEGIGPYEVEDRLKHKAGDVGSLERTHGFVRLPKQHMDKAEALLSLAAIARFYEESEPSGEEEDVWNVELAPLLEEAKERARRAGASESDMSDVFAGLAPVRPAPPAPRAGRSYIVKLSGVFLDGRKVDGEYDAGRSLESARAEAAEWAARGAAPDKIRIGRASDDGDRFETIEYYSDFLKSRKPPASREDVTLLRDGEPVAEHAGGGEAEVRRPGKFQTSGTPGERLHELALESLQDDQAGDVNGPGGRWYGLFLDSGVPGAEYAVASEDSQGFFDFEAFDTAEEAQADFGRIAAEIEEEEEEKETDETEELEEDDELPAPDEADLREAYVVRDKRRGLGYEVVYDGKVLDPGVVSTFVRGRQTSLPRVLDSLTDAARIASKHMENGNYFPDIYYVNERGNVTLLDKDGNEVRSWV